MCFKKDVTLAGQVLALRGHTLSTAGSETASRFRSSQLKLEDALFLMRATRPGCERSTLHPTPNPAPYTLNPTLHPTP